MQNSVTTPASEIDGQAKSIYSEPQNNKISDIIKASDFVLPIVHFTLLQVKNYLNNSLNIHGYTRDHFTCVWCFRVQKSKLHSQKMQARPQVLSSPTFTGYTPQLGILPEFPRPQAGPSRMAPFREWVQCSGVLMAHVECHYYNICLELTTSSMCILENLNSNRISAPWIIWFANKTCSIQKLNNIRHLWNNATAKVNDSSHLPEQSRSFEYTNRKRKCKKNR